MKREKENQIILAEEKDMDDQFFIWSIIVSILTSGLYSSILSVNSCETFSSFAFSSASSSLRASRASRPDASNISPDTGLANAQNVGSQISLQWPNYLQLSTQLIKPNIYLNHSNSCNGDMVSDFTSWPRVCTLLGF